MSRSDIQHRRTHNLLLISKLLSQREHASLFTLVLDSLEQPAKPLLREYIRRSNLSKTFTIFLTFETVQQPPGVDAFIPCWDKTPDAIRDAVASASPQPTHAAQRVLIVIDSLIPLAMLSTTPDNSLNLTAYLGSIMSPSRTSQRPQISIVAGYHSDVELVSHHHDYSPAPLSLLSYLATTILTVHCLPILLAEKAARDRSLPAPNFGLTEGATGVVVGLKSSPRQIKPSECGIVLEMEHRRKSGRGVHEWYFLPAAPKTQSLTPQTFRENLTLLDDHPLFSSRQEDAMSDQEMASMTFELGLTDRQRQEREGVVLPYFDAQKAGVSGGPGEGGRILYDMGVEDDFDEEEDEI